MPKGLWALVNFVIPFAATFRKRPVVCGHTKVTMSALAKVKMSCFSNVADAERGWSRRGSLALNGLKIRRVSRGCCGRCYTTLASTAGDAACNSPPSCSARARGRLPGPYCFRLPPAVQPRSTRRPGPAPFKLEWDMSRASLFPCPGSICGPAVRCTGPDILALAK